MRRVEPPVLSLLVGDDPTRVSDKVWHGNVFSQYGQRKAYIKVLTGKKLLVECVAAVVGRAHDLPIPRPHLVKVEARQLKGSGLPDGTYWAFGCEDSDVPSLSRITRDRDEIAKRLKSWKRVNEAAAFDTWIGNQDRTAKNLLWSDDSTKVGLIDHDDAFPEWLAADAESANELMRLLCEDCDEFTRRRHHREAIKSTRAYRETDWTSSESCTAWVRHFAHEEQLLPLIEFLQQRLQHLPALIAAGTGANQLEMRYDAGPNSQTA